MLATWFITSSDSCTLVVATMLSLGDDHPPQRFRVIWGTVAGLVSAVLLVADGLRAVAGRLHRRRPSSERRAAGDGVRRAEVAGGGLLGCVVPAYS